MTELPVEGSARLGQPAPESPAVAETPPAPEREPEEEHLEQPPRALDPALLYFVLLAVTLLGLNNIAAEVRYTIAWTAMATIAVFFISLDKISIDAATMRELIIGLGMGALIGLPLFGIGAPQLQPLSQRIFGKIGDVAAFQMLAFVMPVAEGMYFRLVLQAARGPVFAALAGGFWSIVLFFPQLDLRQAFLVGVVIGLAFLFANAIYSYLRQRVGLLASVVCQIVVNLLLLFAVRFVTG